MKIRNHYPSIRIFPSVTHYESSTREKSDSVYNHDLSSSIPSSVETSHSGSDGNGFYYPSNVTHFLWTYVTSKFLNCDRDLADQMERRFNLYQKTAQLNITVRPMVHIAQTLNSLEKRYWLAGGTLLGNRWSVNSC
jgi:hypothetical protein